MYKQTSDWRNLLLFAHKTLQPLQVDENMVQSSICSFANGSSAGTDGLRPQHLKDIISLSAGEAGRRALASITKSVNYSTVHHYVPCLRKMVKFVQ